MSEAITLDNLPILDHTRWAVDQAHYDPSISVEAPLINQISSIVSDAPYIESKLEALLGLHQTNRPWAYFPEMKVRPNPSCFSRVGIIPQMAHIDELLKKVVILLDSDMEESPGRQRRLKRLMLFLERLDFLQKILVDTYGRIAQLQRG